MAAYGLVQGVVNTPCTTPPSPVSGATVELLSTATMQRVLGPLTTDARGIYKIWYAAGSYTMRVTKGGFCPRLLPLTILPAQTATQNVFLLPSPNCKCQFTSYLMSLYLHTQTLPSALLLLLALFGLFLPVGYIGKLLLFFIFLTSIIVMAGFHAWQEAIDRLPKWEIVSVREGAESPEGVPEPRSET